MRKINFQLLLGFVFYTTIITGQCWKSVSVGYTHVLAITEDNKLWGWGNNGYGQLGDGTNISKNSPTQINSDTDWKIVSAGSGPVAFTLAIKNDGTLWGWGNNAYGQVGDGTFINKNIPTQIGTENNWKSISAGYSHALAIKEDGTLWSWGDSTLFALGNTTGYGEGFHRNIPAQVGTLSTWVMASAGKEYSLGLRTDARVYGWGRNNANQLGLTNQSTYIINPSSRTGFNSTNTKYTSAGGVHSYDVKNTTDQIVVYGSNVFGQGGGTTCAGCPNYYVKEMDCGDNTSAIIKQDGTLWFTGVKLGYEEPTVQYTSTFLQLGTANNWKSVSVGNQSAAAINMNGEMFTW